MDTCTCTGGGNTLLQQPTSWKCPSDAELSERGRLGLGWSTRTAVQSGKVTASLREDEWRYIRKAIRMAEHFDRRDEMRVKNLHKQLCKQAKAPTNEQLNPYSCHVCSCTYNFVTQAIQLTSCSQCYRVVCKNCRVMGSDPTARSSGTHAWHCKVCADSETFWKKSGSWFHGKLPTYLPDVNQVIEDNHNQGSENCPTSVNSDAPTSGYSTCTSQCTSPEPEPAPRNRKWRCDTRRGSGTRYHARSKTATSRNGRARSPCRVILQSGASPPLYVHDIARGSYALK